MRGPKFHSTYGVSPSLSMHFPQLIGNEALLTAFHISSGFSFQNSSTTLTTLQYAECNSPLYQQILGSIRIPKWLER